MHHPQQCSGPKGRGVLWWVLGLAVALVAVIAALSSAVILRALPNPDELFERRVIQSTKIYDRSGSILLWEIHGEERRTVVPLAEIPPAVKNATVSIEDAGFWRHRGIDIRGVLRALAADIRSRDFRQGGSTITQQLVKNSLLGHERTLSRKLREAVYALAVESRLPKEKILELYLNQIPYGQNAYGVAAAAETFFGKRAAELSVAQAALLAALPRAPSYYSPYGEHLEELLVRKDHIIERMASLGYLAPEEAMAAKAEHLEFLPASRGIRAPHFVMFVRDYLVARYGEEEVESGGLSVTTTLDWELQEEAERIVAEYAGRNESLIKAANMALAAVDPKTGEILAMVGSADYFASPIPNGCRPGIDCRLDPNVNTTLRLRQPGSAFKPFVYATAFAKGLRPETVIFDIPTEFNPGCSPDGVPRPGSGVSAEDCYHPGNYDETFRGPVALRQAIAQSLNVPSVKVLYLAGVDDSISTAEALGITTLKDRSRFGLSLVLGGAEVRLLEMVGAFGAFAGNGVLHAPTSILKVNAADGRTLEEQRGVGRLALDPEVARTISDVLSDNDARIPVFQPRSSLYFPDRDVAVKTGTTQDFRDAWTIGYAPGIVVGVWAGNSDNSPMQQKGSGVMAAAPAWHAFMEAVLQKMPPEQFTPPSSYEITRPVLKGIWQGDVVVTMDSVSGKLATDLTPPEMRQDRALGTPHDPLYWINRSDPAGPPPQSPAEDPQYPNWEASFERWLSASGFVARPVAAAPKEFDDIHTETNRPRITVEARFVDGGGFSISARTESKFEIREIAILAGGRVVASRLSPERQTGFLVPPDALGENTDLEVRAYDAVGNTGTAIVEVSRTTPGD